MTSFWNNLKKPFFALAPLADVTDPAFRSIIAKYGKPDVIWTEFVSADGLAHPEAREKLLHSFLYNENERPIVAQIFGAKPENIKTASRLVASLGFEGVDINMGCPDKRIDKQGAGAALIKTPKLAREIIRAAKEGAGDIPVSVKTRIGYNKNEIDEWIPEILAENPAAITVHLRTRKEMSKAKAQWSLMPKIVELVKETDIVVIGNGDVLDINDAKEKAKESGVDGVMLGRAIFGNPWLFNQEINKKDITIKERMQVMVEHTNLFEKLCGCRNFAIMKKHYKAYSAGFEGSKELRIKLMATKNAKEVEQIVTSSSIFS